MRSIIIIILILIVIGVWRLSVPSQSPVDIGFFDDVECVISCWQGLKPEQSTLDEVEAFYTSNFDRFQTHEGDEGQTLFSAIQNDGDYNVIASFQNDTLVDVFLRANSAPSFDLELDRIFQTLGESDYTRISYEMAVETTDIYPYIELYYPEAGYIFRAYLNISSRSDDRIEVCVHEDTTVSEVHIVAPNPIRELIIDSRYYTGVEPIPESIDALVDGLSQWDGYRCYDLTYPPIPVD